MAVRFVKPIQTPYESQFVPMPLEFMYKNLQEQQAALDKARGVVAETQVKIEGPPWWEQAGYVQAKQKEYNKRISDLATQLELNKENPQMALSGISKLNKDFLEDEIVQTMSRQNKLWEPIAKKAADDPNASSAFYLDKKEFDPTTKSWKWKNPFLIADEMIKAPVFAETDKYITENLVKWLQPSLQEAYGNDLQLRYLPQLNKYQVLKPDSKGQLVEVLLDDEKMAPLISNAITNFADYIANTDQHSQARLIREGLSYGSDPTPYYGRDTTKIRDLIHGVASKVFRTKVIEKPGDYEYIARNDGSSGGGGGGGGITTPVQQLDFTVFPGQTMDLTSASNQKAAITAKNLESGIELRSNNLFNNTLRELISVDRVGGSPEATQALDQINAIFTQVAQDASSVYSGVSESNRDKLNDILKDPTKTFKVLLGKTATFDKDVSTIRNLLGDKYYKTLRTEIFSALGELANSPDKQTQGIAQDFWNNYAMLEYEQSQLELLNKTMELNAESFIDQAINLGLFNDKEKKYLSDKNTRKVFSSILAKALGGDQESIDQLDESIWEEADVVLGQRMSTDLEEGIWHKIRDNRDKLEAKAGEQEYVLELTDKKSSLTSYTNKLKENYNLNSNDLLALLQGYSKNFIGESVANQNSLSAIFNSSPYKSPGFNLNENAIPKELIQDVRLGKLGNSSMPVLYITAKDSDKEDYKTSVIPVPLTDKSQLRKIIFEFITDDNADVQAFGAELYGRSVINEGTLSYIGTMFDIKKSSGKIKDTEIKFTTGGAPFILKAENNQISLGRDVNGTFSPIGKQKTIDGRDLDVLFNNMDQFLEYVGYYSIYKNLYEKELNKK